MIFKIFLGYLPITIEKVFELTSPRCVFFINTIKAVNEYEELLRAAIASASNDHRLGANEAPPAIISVFIGTQLTNVLDALEKVKNEEKSISKEDIPIKEELSKVAN